MKPIDVAVGIILDSSKSKALVAQRNNNDEHFGKWEFPGGKINQNESVEQALTRELKEELDIEIIKFEPFETFKYHYTQRKVNLNFYLVTEFIGKPKGQDGQKIKWEDIANLQQLDMLQANQRVIEKLQVIFL